MEILFGLLKGILGVVALIVLLPIGLVVALKIWLVSLWSSNVFEVPNSRARIWIDRPGLSTGPWLSVHGEDGRINRICMHYSMSGRMQLYAVGRNKFVLDGSTNTFIIDMSTLTFEGPRDWMDSDRNQQCFLGRESGPAA